LQGANLFATKTLHKHYYFCLLNYSKKGSNGFYLLFDPGMLMRNCTHVTSDVRTDVTAYVDWEFTLNCTDLASLWTKYFKNKVIVENSQVHDWIIYFITKCVVVEKIQSSKLKASNSLLITVTVTYMQVAVQLRSSGLFWYACAYGHKNGHVWALHCVRENPALFYCRNVTPTSTKSVSFSDKPHLHRYTVAISHNLRRFPIPWILFLLFSGLVW